MSLSVSVLTLFLTALSAAFKPLLVLFGPLELDRANFLVMQARVDQLLIKFLCRILPDRFVEVRH